MIILLYFFSSMFIVLGFMMLFGFWRTRRWEFILLSFVYAGSGIAGGSSAQWWPLIAGFVVVWLLKFAGYDADRIMQEFERARAASGTGSAPPPGSGS